MILKNNIGLIHICLDAEPTKQSLKPELEKIESIEKPIKY